jgi:hypothetical protein
VTKFTLITPPINRQLWITFYPEKRRPGNSLEVVWVKGVDKKNVGVSARFYLVGSVGSVGSGGSRGSGELGNVGAFGGLGLILR